MLDALVLRELPTTVVELEYQLSLDDVAPGHLEERPLVPAPPVEHHRRVHGAGDAVGAGYGVERVRVVHLSLVVHEQDGEPEAVSKLLEGAHVAVVGELRAVGTVSQRGATWLASRWR